MELIKMKVNKKTKDFIIQAIKFGMVGVLNTIVGFGTYTLCFYLFHMDDRLANVISYILGLTNSFIFNKFWTFRSSQKPFREIVFFFIVFLAAFGVQYTVYSALKVYLHMLPIFAYISGMVVYTVTGFIGNKLLTFRETTAE